MTARLVIVGAGGHGREVHDVVEAINEAVPAGQPPVWECLGFLDDGDPDPAPLRTRGVGVLGSVALLEQLPPDVGYVVGVGNGGVRGRVGHLADRWGRKAAILVHPTAVVGRHGVVLGPGTVVCALAAVTTDVVLGRHVLVNRGAHVSHDCRLGDHVTVNPLVTVSGGVVVGECAELGTGASVRQGVRIGARTTVGAGAAVVTDLPDDVVAVGVPARPR